MTTINPSKGNMPPSPPLTAASDFEAQLNEKNSKIEALKAEIQRKKQLVYKVMKRNTKLKRQTEYDTQLKTEAAQYLKLMLDDNEEIMRDNCRLGKLIQEYNDKGVHLCDGDRMVDDDDDDEVEEVNEEEEDKSMDDSRSCEFDFEGNSDNNENGNCNDGSSIDGTSYSEGEEESSDSNSDSDSNGSRSIALMRRGKLCYAMIKL